MLATSRSRRTGKRLRRSVGAVIVLGALAVPGVLVAGFLPADDYPVGANPVALAAGDFDKDGTPDLVVANHDDGDVSILEANTSAPLSFEPAADYPVGPGAQAVAVADFSGDHGLDIAVANEGDGTVSVLEADFAGGSFEPKIDYPSGGRPSAMVARDFNRDGRPDLAVANLDSSVSILLNGPGLGPVGSFAEPVLYDVGGTPSSIAVGDLNFDLRPDLAVANSDKDYVSVLLADNQGSFSPAVAYQVGAHSSSVAMGFLDSKAGRDLAVARVDGTVSILSNKGGDGAFKAKAPFPVGSNPISIVAGHFNGDTKEDLAVANSDDGDVSVLLGTSSGVFERRDYPVGANPSSIAAVVQQGGANGNRNDIVVANAGDGEISVLINDGS